MKKQFVCLISILLFVLVITSCSKSNLDPIKKDVLLIKAEQLSDSLKVFNYDIVDRTIKIIDKDKIDNKKTISFLGSRYDAVYQYTIKYVIGDIEVDRYDISDSEKNEYILLKDDLIYAIISKPIVLEIDKNCLPDECVSIIESTLEEYFDFEQYDGYKVAHPDYGDIDHFDKYVITWYRKAFGYNTTDYLTMMVSDNGEVGPIWIKDSLNRDFNNIEGDLNYNNYISEIESKLAESINSSMFSYDSFETTDVYITKYDGDNYFYVQGNVRVIDTNQPEEILSEKVELLIKIK